MTTKAEEIAAGLSAAQLSVLKRMEADYAITPGAWTVPEYEYIEANGRLFKPMFAGRDKGFGHALTAFGRRVQLAAIAMETRRAIDAEGGVVAKP